VKKESSETKKGSAKNHDTKSRKKITAIRRNEVGGSGACGGARAENVKASVVRGEEGIAEAFHTERPCDHGVR
jgi:hypothetical protein